MTLQRMLALLILIETLHARLSNQVDVLDSVLDEDIPSVLQKIRLVAIESIRILRNALATLETQRVVSYLTFHNRLARYLRAHAHLPPSGDVDDSSDSMPSLEASMDQQIHMVKKRENPLKLENCSH